MGMTVASIPKIKLNTDILHIPYQPPNFKTFLYESFFLVHMGMTVASIAEK